MKNKLLFSLAIASGSVLLVLVGLLLGSYWRKKDPPPPDAVSDSRTTVIASPGKVLERREVPNPPPPPQPVANPDRVRQNLRPGKTYVTHTKGTLHVRATDKDWGVEEVITINYAFEAQIDRKIESNDGTTIVETRHFRDVRSLKLETRLEDVRLELGPVGDLLLVGISAMQPEASPAAASVIKRLDGASLKSVIQTLRWVGVSPEKLAGLDEAVKGFATVDRLSGKSVRLTYVDGKGVIKVEPVKGEMTAAERDFHMQSVLLSDSLIIPDVDIKIGNRWSVDGANFANMVDPSLLARTSGEITLERAPDHIVRGETCRHVKAVGGRMIFEDSNPRVGQIGYFEPQGSLYFSLSDQIIVQANFQGKAKLEKFSKDHLLFEARMRRLPELDILYTCRMTDSLKKKP